MIKIKELFDKYREIILYLFFGGCTTLVNIVAYYICSRIGFGTAISTIIAWVLSVMFAYVTNRVYVFKSKAVGFDAVLKEALSFFLCRLATGIFDLIFMIIFVDWLNFNDMIIKVLSNIFVIVLNYIASKLMIFKDKPKGNNKEQKSFLNFLLRIPFLLRALFCFFIAVTLLLLIFIDKNINEYFIPNCLTISNKLLVLPALLLLALIVSIPNLLKHIKNTNISKKQISDKKFYIVILLVFISVFILQLFVSSHICFKAGWDVGRLRDAAEDIVLHGADGVPNWYFDLYPNNLLMTYTLVFLYRVGVLLFDSDYYSFIIAFTNFVVCVSVFLATLCIYKITNSRKFTVCGMLIGIILTAFSPWIIIPYTDSVPMIFPVLAVFFYLYIKNQYIRYLLVTFACTLGYYYKPTIIIVLIALVILKLFVLAEKLFTKKLSIKRSACLLLCVIISFMSTFGINKAMCSQNKTDLDENKQMTITHYLMLGLNPYTEGVYCEEDMVYSRDFPDVKSRQKANLEVAKSRLKSMGAKGYIELLIKKNISTYNDATFGWGREGNFYLEVPEDNRPATKFLRSFYDTNVQGINYRIFATAEQILWLFMLICICFCAFHFKTKCDAENLIALSLLGVSIFLLIFECRARYLFVFTPLFVMLSTVGLYKAYMMANKYVFQK